MDNEKVLAEVEAPNVHEERDWASLTPNILRLIMSRSRLDEIKYFRMGQIATVYMDGVFYFLGIKRKLAMFDPEEESWTVLSTPKPPTCRSVDQNYIMKSNDAIHRHPTSFSSKAMVKKMENKIYFPKIYGTSSNFYLLGTGVYHSSFGNTVNSRVRYRRICAVLGLNPKWKFYHEEVQGIEESEENLPIARRSIVMFR
ncbi:hypothetical protein GIB67_037110 [Kingdonia uniflora]|uniref:Uncharacterized protein n=1 Tax=Kingdonia uniflora TaxID=39325 RepID=A0A7J7LHX6_9MAGN|nr:hypothetical protein GIB67_037110 [Kingdonia uniflora]